MNYSIIQKYDGLLSKGQVIYDEDGNEAWIHEINYNVFESWTKCFMITISTDIDPFTVSEGDFIYDPEGNEIAQIVGVLE
tara:strand:+ start:1325 stop:1564 length:240 start_codon:yes stop_codon:yes gene_type:complete